MLEYAMICQDCNPLGVGNFRLLTPEWLRPLLDYMDNCLILQYNSAAWVSAHLLLIGFHD